MRMPTSFRPSTWLRRSAAPASLCLLLTACGGGGDGDAGNTNVYNLDTAITRALQDGLQINGLTGSANGVSFTLSMTFTPQPDAVFEGVLRKAVRQTITISGGGSTTTTTGIAYFGTQPYVDAGAVYDDGGVDVAVATGQLPTAARVGSTGPLSTTVSYANATKQRIDATGTTTWSLDADGSSNALACLRSELRETGSTAVITGRQCFRINTAGAVLGTVLSVNLGGTSIEFR